MGVRVVVERWWRVGKVRGVERVREGGRGAWTITQQPSVSCELHPSSAAARHFNPHLQRLSVA